MQSVLFLIEDEYKLNRLRSVIEDDSIGVFYMFTKAEDAIESAVNNKIDIAFITIHGNIVSGSEIAELLYDNNPGIKFCFIHNNDNVEESVSLFNSFGESKIISIDSLTATIIKGIVKDFEDLNTQEQFLNKEFDDFKKVESAYKKKMQDISTILNTRLACYKSVKNIYLAAYQYLFEKEPVNSEIVNRFFDEEFDSFITLFLDRTINIDVYFEELLLKYFSKEDKRLFSLAVKKNDLYNYNGSELLAAFVTKMVCDLFYNFCNEYRGKADISFGSENTRVDIIYDLRASQIKEIEFNHIVQIIKRIGDSISDTFIIVNKNGYMQYRAIFNY